MILTCIILECVSTKGEMKMNMLVSFMYICIYAYVSCLCVHTCKRVKVKGEL